MSQSHSETSGRPTSVAEPETGTRLSAIEIHDNVLGSAEEELDRPAAALFYSALAAGLTIGFSFLAGAFLQHVSPAPLGPLVNAAAYPLGFIFVIRARSELFTENTLEPIIPLLHRRDGRTLRQTLRLWGILIIGNLLGCVIFALVFAHTDAVDGPLRTQMLDMAVRATSSTVGLTFLHAVFAGWLLALLTWLLASTTSAGAQITLIWLATAPIAALDFKHSIAGSTEAFYRAAMGAAGWGEMLVRFTAPALVGNAVGGVVLVALLNYGQIAQEHAERGGAGSRT
jgi:formate/nitrite transporter FocA (FNT family)